MREGLNKAIIQSYVWHDGKCFFVSTINRESSAIGGGTYAETMVFEWDAQERKRGKIVAQDQGSTNSIYAHQNVCKLIHETGKTSADED